MKFVRIDKLKSAVVKGRPFILPKGRKDGFLSDVYLAYSQFSKTALFLKADYATAVSYLDNLLFNTEMASVWQALEPLPSRGPRKRKGKNRRRHVDLFLFGILSTIMAWPHLQNRKESVRKKEMTEKMQKFARAAGTLARHFEDFNIQYTLARQGAPNGKTGDAAFEAYLGMFSTLTAYKTAAEEIIARGFENDPVTQFAALLPQKTNRSANEVFRDFLINRLLFVTSVAPIYPRQTIIATTVNIVTGIETCVGDVNQSEIRLRKAGKLSSKSRNLSS